MPGLQGNVKVPGIGEVPKGAAVLGLGGVGVAIYLYRKHQASSTTAANPAPGSDPYPPDGTTGNPSDPYSTDPATGVTYGDEQIGYGAGLGYGAGGLGGTSGWDSQTGLYTDPNGMTCANPGLNGYCPGSSGGGPPFSTNAQWAQYVITQLTSGGTQGFDQGTVTDAIGTYLAGGQMTTAQQQIANDAIAIGGAVPVAAASGFPPSMHVGGGGGGGGKAVNPVTGLKATAGYTGIDVSWNASQNATSYTVTAPGASNSPENVTTTSTRMRNEPHSKTVTITVLANPAASGVHPASVTVHTK